MLQRRVPGHSLSYPADLVRRQDRGRFVSVLFAPPERREDLFALYAFGLELAQVRSKAREPIARLIRLQWWRDALSAEDKGPRTPSGHPVAEALALAIARHRLPHASVESVIDAWEDEMDSEPPPSPESLMAQVEKTSLPLASLGLAILGVSDGESIKAAEHVAMAWGLAALLRVAPPSTLAGVTAHALSHIAEARHFRHRVPREALPLLLPAVLAERYLTRVRRGGYAADEMIFRWSRPGVLRLLMAHRLARF